MINKFETFEITHSARIALLLTCTKNTTPLFSEWPNVINEIDSMINDAWNWLQVRQPDCSTIYQKYNPLLIEFELRLHNNEMLLKAFHAVLYMHYYVIEKMYVTEYFENKKEPIVGEDVFEVTEDYFFNCLNNCIEVSKSPIETEHFISEKIERLKKEYTSKNGSVLSDKKISKSFFT